MMLVTGGTGQVGTAVRAFVPDAVAPSRDALDLSRPAGLPDALARFAPSAIINCAGYTAVDRAEMEEDLATVVNGEAVGVMATWAAEAGIPFVTMSTDYVFDGTADEPYVESDDTNPINAYGRSKLVGERAALAAYRDALVVRASWVVSGTHHNFVATVLRLLAERGSMDVVDDQTGSPTMAGDLARAVLDAVGAGVGGLLHLTNAGATSWHGLAREVAMLSGHDPSVIRPVTSAEFGAPAQRPGYSVMESERLEELGLTPMPGWRDSLPAVVEQLREAV